MEICALIDLKRLKKFVQRSGHITNKLSLDIAEILLQTAPGRRIGRAILLARNGLERRREIRKNIDGVLQLISRFLRDVSHSSTSQGRRAHGHTERVHKPEESENRLIEGTLPNIKREKQKQAGLAIGKIGKRGGASKRGRGVGKRASAGAGARRCTTTLVQIGQQPRTETEDGREKKHNMVSHE